MLKKMRRMLSTLYPYHMTKKSNAQKLIDFPLQFYTERPQKETRSLLYNMSFNDSYPEILKGAEHSCGVFLSLLADQNLKVLEDLVEWNMFKAIEKSFKSYQDLGYTITSIGSTENPKVDIFDYNIHNGFIVPYRNINRKISEYKISSSNIKEPLPTTHIWDPKSWFEVLSGLYKFSIPRSLNLKEMNETGTARLDRQQLNNLYFFLLLNSVHIHVFDIGYRSTFKLIVRDKEGKIIEGNDDEDKLEFHSFRIEKISYEKRFFSSIFSPRRDINEFLEEMFPGLLNQFIISDVDGFMNGNPFAT